MGGSRRERGVRGKEVLSLSAIEPFFLHCLLACTRFKCLLYTSIIFRIALLLVLRDKPCEEYTERERKRSSSMKMPFNIGGNVRWFYESVVT